MEVEYMLQIYLDIYVPPPFFGLYVSYSSCNLEETNHIFSLFLYTIKVKILYKLLYNYMKRNFFSVLNYGHWFEFLTCHGAWLFELCAFLGQSDRKVSAPTTNFGHFNLVHLFWLLKSNLKWELSKP